MRKEEKFFEKDKGDPHEKEDWSQLLETAYEASYENKESILKSHVCGCYYCQHIFSRREIDREDFVKDKNGYTATCPYCGADTVIGDASGCPITKDFLAEMHRKHFKKQVAKAAPKAPKENAPFYAAVAHKRKKKK